MCSKQMQLKSSGKILQESSYIVLKYTQQARDKGGGSWWRITNWDLKKN